MTESPAVCLHDLFAAQRAARPDHTAIIAPDVQLGYAELSRRADRLAARLGGLGVQPNTLVAVVLDKGPAQAVAVLGVLQAGAAYLPIDPGVPDERRLHLLSRGEVRVAVVSPDDAARLDWPPEVTLVPVGPDGLVGSDGPAGVSSQASPTDLAYVIFTSGSTGEPKGVMIDHAAAANTVLDINRRWQVGPGDRVLALSSLTFDLSVYDLLGTLAAGATVVYPPAGATRDAQVWAELVRTRRVTIWNSVPALAELLVEAAGDRSQPLGASLRLMLLSGDWIPLTLPARLRQLVPDLQLVSLGGATEASIWSIHHPIDRVDPHWDSIPYGRPLTGQDVLVLDEQLQPTPPGQRGHLYIVGAGLARGYWREPRLTARHFITHPSSGQRLYRTGDLGRRWPDGTIELLGREDLQVKIDGNRVELTEVEAALSAHPEVRLAVATAVGPARGQRRLAGYVVLRQGARLTGQQLREFAARRVPGYLVPAVVTVLDQLPLTANGKVDRARLPAPDFAAAAGGAQPESGPTSATERAVLDVWRGLLGVADLGAHHDVFTFGATSLFATRAAARLRERFGVELPLATVFEQPTPAGLAAALDKVLDSASAAPGAGSAGSLVPQPQPRPAPLSLFQEQVAFLDRLSGSNAYNFQCTVHFTGQLDVALLERSLNEVIARHEVLRTEFREVDGTAVQVVLPTYRYYLPVVDLTRVPPEERTAAADRIIAEEFAARFDVGRLPLFRWKLLVLGPQDHLLVQVEHHFVHDGWSLALLWSELTELYTAGCEHRPAALPTLPVQYSDFALWQRAQVAGPAGARHLQFWRDRLADPPPPLDLPFARPRPARQTFRGSALRTRVPLDRYRGLREFSRANRVSLFMTMFAGFVALLHRYTGRTDLCVGTGVANRADPAAQPLIGMMVNNVALRIAVGPDTTFQELLRQVHDQALAVHSHQELPFEQVVRAVNPPRDARHSPLVQVLFSCHDSPMPRLAWPGVTGRLVERNNGTAKFDLNIIAFTRAEQRGAANLDPDQDFLDLHWEYNTDLFDEPCIARMAEHLQVLLDAAVAEPATPVRRLPLLPETQAAELARHCAGMVTGYPRHLGVPELFAEQAAARPDALAVVGDGRRLSYRELDQAAKRLARRLVAAGVGPEVPVGVLLGRSVDFVVAVLAVLEAGGAYVPLDPDYPPARLANMLDRVQAPVVVTRADLADRMPAGRARTVLVSQQPPSGPSGEAAGGPDAEVGVRPTRSPEQAAYVIFTSGSTGEPKAVVVPHRGIVRLVRDTDYAQPTPDDVMLQVSSVSFDACTFEIWGALLNGASIVIGPPRAPAPAELARLIREHAVTTMFVTTGLFHLFVDDHLDELGGLRILLAGGDQMSVARIAKAAAALPHCAVSNIYGPTEGTTFSTWFPMPPGWTGTAGGVSGGPSSVPIGRPIANTTVRILDDHGEPAPIGVPGQLYIGGDGLARGYFGDPATTAARFVPDRFATEPGARLYATGDLARWLPDGTIEFLGRSDHQVKIRGFRVEPGEIEETLRGHPLVRDAAVVPFGVAAEDRRLVAYLVLVPDVGELDLADIRAWLRRRLPGYLVPDLWMTLPRLPLNANGKLDRGALPTPGSAGPTAAATAEPAALTASAPSGEERVIAAIWARILHRDRVGPHDNFFDLGGHSLLAAKMVAALRDELEVEVPTSLIFDFPTVAELAQLIRDSG